jgi:hypothetical protein
MVHLFASPPARRDGDHIADSEGGVRVVDEDVAGAVEMLDTIVST